MSDLYARIYEIVRLIPAGRVSSYGAIARYVGSPRGARMVGWAMNQSHSQKEYTPAHRVVNRMGMLSGKHHFPGENVMQELLESEGVVVLKDQIQNFDEIFWDPFQELDANVI
ncbi:MGMT family protein [Labilibaculum sp.]|uniref:MGMT family protein n=1 Tax=Labilibaculum sp. TaxID=2060723 RepID=UPI003564E96F